MIPSIKYLYIPTKTIINIFKKPSNESDGFLNMNIAMYYKHAKAIIYLFFVFFKREIEKNKFYIYKCMKYIKIALLFSVN